MNVTSRSIDIIESSVDKDYMVKKEDLSIDKYVDGLRRPQSYVKICINYVNVKPTKVNLMASFQWSLFLPLFGL